MSQSHQPKNLYQSSFEHDNCGIGAVVNIQGKASHSIVDDALKIVENLEHRAGKDAKGETGDGVGILTQISHRFFKEAAAKDGITLAEIDGVVAVLSVQDVDVEAAHDVIVAGAAIDGVVV